MTAKRFFIGTLAGACTLFAWETVSNTAIPWHEPTYAAFQDSNAVIQAIRAGAPQNGMYVDARGVVAAVALRPDLASRESLMGMMLGRQAVLDLFAVALVFLVLIRIPRMSALQYALAVGAVAAAVSTSAFASDWNWYGFGGLWALVNIVDRTIGYTLVGLVLGVLINRWSTRTTTDEWSGVRSSGALPAAKTTPRSALKV